MGHRRRAAALLDSWDDPSFPGRPSPPTRSLNGLIASFDTHLPGSRSCGDRPRWNPGRPRDTPLTPLGW